MRAFPGAVVLALGLGTLAACGPSTVSDRRTDASEPVDGRPVPERDDTLVVLPAGAPAPDGARHVAWVEVSATPEARRRGLMGRTRLEPDHGMLFVYPRAEPRRYWMKDCPLPLDVCFVRDDGRIARIASLPAGAGLPPEAVPSADSGEPVRYVLEMEGGWFAGRGIGAGRRVDVSAAAAGAEPR